MRPAKRVAGFSARGWLCGLLLTMAVHPGLVAADPIAHVLGLSQASLMVEEKGRPVIARNADRPMVPASTLKLLTALMSIERWGLDHRFRTDFFVDDAGWLWVKGYGDPFLVSEELDLIVAALVAKGVDRVVGIGTDDTYFAADVKIAGRSATDHPYDAPVAALAVNFNTINVRVGAGGVASAESQTPLTPLAGTLARGLGPGKQRINLGRRELAPRYFAEVLAAKLRGAGVQMDDTWRSGVVPASAKHIYGHRNSRDLREVIAAMLEYSSNFSANHLFLLLGEKGDETSPLTIATAREAVQQWVDKTFDWRDYHIEEGAGLSRGNRLSARQLMDLVKAFAPYLDLLPEKDGVRAKTGTLRGVSCYAGFVRRDGEWAPFSLLINESVPYRLREQVASALAERRDLAGYCRAANC